MEIHAGRAATSRVNVSVSLCHQMWSLSPETLIWRYIMPVDNRLLVPDELQQPIVGRQIVVGAQPQAVLRRQGG